MQFFKKAVGSYFCFVPTMTGNIALLTSFAPKMTLNFSVHPHNLLFLRLKVNFAFPN